MNTKLCLATGLTAMTAWSLPAAAHIDVDMGGTHMQRPGDQKTAPCGTAGSTRGTNVYTYKPGTTINITIMETVGHPGYFRISFDDDGDDDFVIPTGTNGENGDCAGDPACGPGKEDYCSNDTVLIDNLEPHADNLFSGVHERSFSVTLPNIECDNCTLQIMQMMNDFNFHPAPYPQDDIYYRCIDITLSNDADEYTETPVQNEGGMVCQRSTDPGTGGAMATGGEMATGGMVVTGGAMATGGMAATGGAMATGGMAATGAAMASGGEEEPPRQVIEVQESGCSVATGRQTGAWLSLGLIGLALASLRRRN